MSGTVAATTYLDLITAEHVGQPNFTATVSTSVQPFVDVQNMLLSMPGLYDFDNAVGTQLDADGLWIGLSRFVDTPLTGVYFAWDTPGLGWDQGYWQGEFDPSQGVTVLNDPTYLIALRAKIAANNWDGTISGAASALENLFNNTETPGTLLFIEDGQDMTMTFGIAGDIPPTIISALLTNGGIPLVPAGINADFIETSVNGSAIFGFDVGNEYVSGWDVGAWGLELT
jgi:hypothetical protein